jgi:hypothetical protein
MRPVDPKIGGALYRPTTTAACGTTTVVDDSLSYRVFKFVNGREFQRTVGQDRQDVNRIDRISPVHPETIL